MPARTLRVLQKRNRADNSIPCSHLHLLQDAERPGMHSFAPRGNEKSYQLFREWSGADFPKQLTGIYYGFLTELGHSQKIRNKSLLFFQKIG
jgi:hypothetical protein